jgi:leucyl aminopeptidase
MIPTSTKTTIAVTAAMPSVEAAVVFINESKPIGASITKMLGPDVVKAANRVISAGLIKGKAKEIAVELLDGGPGPKRGYVVGLGKTEKMTPEIIRQSAGALTRTLIKHKISRVAVALPEPADISAEAIATGILLTSFDYSEHKGTASTKNDEKDQPEPKPLAISIIADKKSLAMAKKTVDSARIICDGQNYARTIASRPGNEINPPTLANEAKLLAKETGLRCTIFNEKQLKKLGMGGILAVGEGSIHALPRLIVLEHKPAKLPKGSRPLLIVGKAITFDTGGISIKPADKMGKMIFDKCGGMTVLGVMYAAAKLNLPVHIVGILSSAENAISSRAYRPGDIIKMYNGVTVEVTNTDAEGRLVLGDALAWGIETYKPSAVVDLATLTGGVIVALGKTMAGIMSNNDKLVKQLESAGEPAGEKMWRLPLGEDQRDYIKSEFADIVNSGGREGHPLQGGAFLSYFIPTDNSIPWAHLDIAGVADTEKELPYYAKGATGWGVRTLINWIQGELK